MNIRIISLFVIVLFIFLPNYAFTRDYTNNKTSFWRGEIFAGYNYNIHKSDLTGLPATSVCCPNYSDGDGHGYHFGLSFGYSFSEKFIAGTRLAVKNLNGDFSSVEKSVVILEGGPVTVKTEHVLSAEISMFGISPFITYDPGNHFEFIGSLSVAKLIKSKYEGHDRLISPTGLSGIRNGYKISGDIPDVNKWLVFLNICVSYKIPLDNNSRKFLAPSIGYSFAGNSVTDGSNWKISGPELTLRFLFDFD